MRTFRNVAAGILFSVAISLGQTTRAAAPPWVTYYCDFQHMFWGLEDLTDDCTDTQAFCSNYCGQTPYGYFCSSHGNGLTDGQCMCTECA
jgi:hypothetical protein